MFKVALAMQAALRAGRVVFSWLQTIPGVGCKSRHFAVAPPSTKQLNYTDASKIYLMRTVLTLLLVGSMAAVFAVFVFPMLNVPLRLISLMLGFYIYCKIVSHFQEKKDGIYTRGGWVAFDDDPEGYKLAFHIIYFFGGLTFLFLFLHALVSTIS